MKVICAWHKKFFPSENDLIEEIEPIEDERETYGICLICREFALID